MKDSRFQPLPGTADQQGVRLGPLIEWMRSQLNEDQPISLLAAKAGMSQRTFQRRFEATTGSSVGEWLLTERLRHARELLERKGEASLDDIATACGFGTPATMRHHFRRRLGTSPGAYRKVFSGCGFAGQCDAEA